MPHHRPSPPKNSSTAASVTHERENRHDHVHELRDVGFHAELDRIDNEIEAHLQLLCRLGNRLAELAANRDNKQITRAFLAVDGAVARLNAARVYLDRVEVAQ